MAKAAINLDNFKVVKFGDGDAERNYINDILHAIVDRANDLQSQIDALGTGSDPSQGQVLTAVPDSTFPNSRVVQGQDGVISIADGGAGSAFTIGVFDGGIDTIQLADAAVTAAKMDVAGTPSATTVIQDDGTTLTYVEVVDTLNTQTGDITLTSSDASITIDATTPGAIDLTVAAVPGSGIETINTIGPDGGFDFTIESLDASVTITPVTNGIDLSVAGGGSGTVTSVALALPAEFTVSGSPVTTSGTLTGVWAVEAANKVFAGPTSGSPATPTFRSLVVADVPTLPYVVSVTDDGNFLVSVDNTDPVNPVVTMGTVADQTFIANNSGGTSQPQAVTAHNATLMLDDFAGAATRGLVPDPGSLSGPSGYSLRADGSWAHSSTGSVTSVGLVLPTEFTVTVSPITTSGDLTAVWANESANKIFAGPTTGSPATPAFRSLVAADLPAGTTPVGANPTASVGLSAVNGSAATFLRSDGAPPLDQGISPTWSGNHTFSNLITASNGLEATGGSIVADAGNVTAGSLGHVRAVGGLTTYSGTPTIYCGIIGNADPPTLGRLFVNGDGTGKIDVLQMAVADGRTTAPVPFNFSSAFALSSVISPSALSSGNNNNYNPTGLATAGVIRLTAGVSPSTITGITAPSTAGQVLILVNAGLLGTVTLSKADTNSTAANRFSMSASVTLNTNDSVAIWYDGTSSRWRVVETFAATVTIPDSNPSCGFSNGGLALATAGTLADEIWIPYAGTITGWTITSDASSSASIVVSHSTYSAYDTMTTLFTATLTTAKKNQATGLSNAVAAGDIIRFSGSSWAGTGTRVKITLDIAH